METMVASVLIKCYDFSAQRIQVYWFNCGGDTSKIHECTIMFKKKWFNSSNKFGNQFQGEGVKLLSNMNGVGLVEVGECLIQVAHQLNITDKEIFYKKDLFIDLVVADDIKLIINTC